MKLRKMLHVNYTQPRPVHARTRCAAFSRACATISSRCARPTSRLLDSPHQPNGDVVADSGSGPPTHTAATADGRRAGQGRPAEPEAPALRPRHHLPLSTCPLTERQAGRPARAQCPSSGVSAGTHEGSREDVQRGAHGGSDDGLDRRSIHKRSRPRERRSPRRQACRLRRGRRRARAWRCAARQSARVPWRASVCESGAPPGR